MLAELRPRIAFLVAPPAGTAELLAAIGERRRRATLRILYLNDISAIEPRLEALAMGFDDALPLTIDPLELIGRVRLLLGGARTPIVERRPMTIAAGIELDVAGRRVVRDGSDIHLRPKEFAILTLLASDPGRVFTRDELVDLAWGSRYRGNIRTVDVHVRWLRAKLEPDPTRPELAVTVRGLGYRLDAPRR
jgi:two-component system response regulator RegX3